MTSEQIKYWNKKTDESKCNWFKLFPENNFDVQDNKVELVHCNVPDNLTDEISEWEDLFETTTSEVSNNPNDAIKGLNNYWKSKTEL